MDVRHLHSFVSVAEAASFSRAAAHLHITQPALSRQIRDLEHELGVRLFDRSSRRVRLTAEGDDLLRRTRDALVAVEALRDRAKSLGTGKAGVLRVGGSPQVLESVLSSFLGRFRRSHPDVDIRLVEHGALRILDLLEEGDIHLGITVHPVHEPIRARPLFPAHVVAAIPPAHRLARRRTVSTADLAREPLLLLQPTFATRQIVDGAFQVARIHPRIALESADPHCLLTLAEDGHGIGIVPSTLLLPRGRVRFAPIVDEQVSLGFWLVVCWDSRRFLPPYGERFVTELVEYTRRSYPGRQFDRVAPPVRRV